MKKEKFTIEGSIELIKAFAKEVNLQNTNFITDEYNVYVVRSHTILQAIFKSSTHFNLFNEYGKAVKYYKEMISNHNNSVPEFKENQWLWFEFDKTCGICRFNGLNNDIASTKEAYQVFNDGLIIETNDFEKYYSYLKKLSIATPEQINNILSKVAKQKGFIKGAKFNNNRTLKIDYNYVMEEDYYRYDSNIDCLCVKYLGGLVPIYQKGMWAEIVKVPNEEVKTFTTLDGVVIRIGIDKSYLVSKLSKRILYDIWRGINNGAVYFADKVKAECYLALLKGEEVERLNHNGWILCRHTPYNYDWANNTYRIKPKTANVENKDYSIPSTTSHLHTPPKQEYKTHVLPIDGNKVTQIIIKAGNEHFISNAKITKIKQEISIVTEFNQIVNIVSFCEGFLNIEVKNKD